jgi:hypothetical protein
MEPRPPKTTRSPSGTPSSVFTPPPVPTSERLAERSAWLDQPPPVAPGQGRDERGALDIGTTPSIAPSQARAAWYDPAGQAAPGMDLGGGGRSPLSPVVAPRGERRGRFLGPILAVLLLILVVAVAAVAVDKLRGGDDGAGAEATRAAELVAPGSTPESTATIAAAGTPTASDAAPTNTAEPTKAVATVEPSPTTRPPTRTPESRASGTLRAADYLPTLGDLPEGFQETKEGRLRKAEVAEQLGSDGDQLLEEWDWRENASLEFQRANAASDETFFLSVSVHRFGRSKGASDGLNGLADVLASIPDLNYEEVDVAKIGDESRAFQSESAEANQYVLYVRSGNIVYRIGGSSLTGDPSADVIALAETLVES